MQIDDGNDQLTFALKKLSTAQLKKTCSMCARQSPTGTSLLHRNAVWLALLISISIFALANCDESTALDSTLGVARRTRNAYWDYSSPFATSDVLKNSSNHSADGGYLNVFGLRTKQKQQQFYPISRSLNPENAGYDDLTSLNLVNGGREDICKGHCLCTRANNAFTTISCDFNKNQRLSPIFGTNFKVPGNATSISIKLAPKTSFRLERGFFSSNTVNSFIIEGAYSESEQVEITTEAFRGNNGPYPEIYMHNVFSVIVRTRAFAGSGKFTVRRSNDLILYPDAFENAKINGLFVGINDLRIQEKAFNSAQAKLRIESSHIDNIYRFEASLHEIRFINCSIGTINGGTFDVININSIIFEGCRIDAIKARAITEKLYSKHVAITGAIIGSIESEAIYGSGIAELILTKNKIDTIHANAIHVTAVNATISRNHIKHLGNNWLRIKEWSNIVIEKNIFGRFGGMLLDETNQPISCRFDGNSITEPLPGSLNITNPHCVLREISVNIPCRCNLQWLYVLSDHDLQSETYCTIDDKLGHCFNATIFNTLKYVNEVCDEKKTVLNCITNMNLAKVNGDFFTPEELAGRDQDKIKLGFIVAASVLLLLLITLVIFCVCRCAKRPKNVDSGSHNSNINALPHLHEFSPQEKQDIEQTMQLLQKKYPKIYRQVNEHTQLMLQPQLSPKRCLKAINKILDLLNKVDAGDDFVAFNRVLSQHVQPQVPTAPVDPLYTEPSQLGSDDGGGFYTSSTIVAMPPQNYECESGVGVRGPLPPPEHIYAELNCAQQPLLPNDYASPADRNHDSMDLYSEPFSQERDLPAGQRPPQYAQPFRIQAQQLPLRPSNLPYQLRPPAGAQALPHVLYQSQINNNNKASENSQPPFSGHKPLTHVQKLAQDLQNKPEFHPNQLIKQRPYIANYVAAPIYTAPTTHKNLTARLASPEAIDESELDMRGAVALAQDSGSSHSGGSNETVKIDDVIEYVDA